MPFLAGFCTVKTEEDSVGRRRVFYHKAMEFALLIFGFLQSWLTCFLERGRLAEVCNTAHAGTAEAVPPSCSHRRNE